MHPVKYSVFPTIIRLPFYEDTVPAGFPSPAADSVSSRLDLNELLITHPISTYFVRVSGDSMRGAGIESGDIAVVDRAIIAKHGHVVIACFNNEFTIKRLCKERGVLRLCPENKKYSDIVPSDDDSLEIFGVVTSVIKKLV